MRTSIAAAVTAILALAGCGGPQSGDSQSAGGQTSGAQAAQPVDEAAARAVKVRQSLLTLVYHNFGPLSNMSRGRIPFDADTAAVNAERLNHLANMLADVFEYDTRGAGVETEALDVIWTNREGFNERAANLVGATDALRTAAMSGDEAQIKEAVGNVGKTCGGCHDDFREDKD